MPSGSCRLFSLPRAIELDAAISLVGNLLKSGQIRDPAEIRFLTDRLEELAARQARARPSSKLRQVR